MSWFRRRSPEDQFADEVAALVQSLLGFKATRVPGFALTIESPDGSPITMNLTNIYAEAQKLTGEERESRLRTAVLGMKPQPRPATWDDAAPKLMPAVRAVSWLSATGLTGLINKPLAPFLTVACAIDFEHAMSFATDEDVSKWNVSVEKALETASANLGSQPVQVGRAGPIALLLEPDGYISSWLAVPSKLRRIANDIGAEVIAIAPARDHLVLVDASNVQVAIKVIDDSLAEYQQAPRQLSPVPYRVGESGIEVWDPPGNHPARMLVDKAQRILAHVEYGVQQATLQELLTKAGEDVYVATYELVQWQDGSVWSWAAWVKQVTNGLVPQVDVLMMGDNDNRGSGVAVRWDDALRIAGGALKWEPRFDPPRWRYVGWPDAATLAALREVAVPFPPPRNDSRGTALN